jgi:hypothetical protein
MLTLLSFLPAEAWVLGFLVLALGVIVGRVKLGTIGAFLLLLLALPFIDPLVESVVDLLPMWLVILVAVAALASLARLLLSFILGRRAADAAIGHLAAMMIAGSARMIGRMVRAVL